MKFYMGQRHWFWSIGIIVSLSILVACSNGGDGTNNKGGNNGIDTKAEVIACTPSDDDSTQNADGSASFVRSHTITPNTFHSIVTRKNRLNQDVTLDYMVHQPAGTPMGIVVLIPGGALTALITGTEGNVATGSGGNFLVRSAHRFMNAGFRVLTMDRPSDFTDYGDIDSANYLYDAYRTSVDHAVDITTMVNRENTDNLPVFIVGTSRGAISAVAQNRLATGIAISSPITSISAAGVAIGSNSLPVNEVKVPVHLLYHQDDGCSVTQPANTAELIKKFANAGIDVDGNVVSGGFVDTIDNNPCGAKSYHGFMGIENCAVNTTTTWIDKLLSFIEAQYPGNARPIVLDQTVSVVNNNALDIPLSASDIDDTILTYSLAFSQSTLGGTLSLNTDVVHYVPPAINTNTTDSFVVTVTDNKGSRSAAVITVSLSLAFNHDFTTGCANNGCHDGASTHTSKSLGHPNTTNICEACHLTTVWSPQLSQIDHSQTVDTCVRCHGASAGIRAKSDIHPLTSDICEACHTTTNWLTLLLPFDHSQVAQLNCVSAGCHSEVEKGLNHILTTFDCGICHTINGWLQLPFDHSTVAEQACSLSGCHDGKSVSTYKSAVHPLTSELCEACHTTTNWLTFRLPFDHSQVTQPNCVSAGCHSEAEKSVGHVLTERDCSVCHLPSAWLPQVTPR